MANPATPSFANALNRYRALVDQGLKELDWSTAQPAGLYAPMDYFMGLGGKRLRPALCLMACEMAGGEAESALPQALALEVFHNFTLLHDDVMDESPLRRGQPTVHLRYGLNAAILSGDALLIEAYRLMVQAKPELMPDLVKEFNRVALQVCQGQQMDMDFQNREEVSLSEYREMIGLKTAVLLGSSLKIGAMMGGASATDAQAMFRVGYLTGLAFQVQDDWLDVYGDPKRFGKQIAGDIKACKHNFLRVTAMQEATHEQMKHLISTFARLRTYLDQEKDEGDVQALEAQRQEWVDDTTGCYNEIGLKQKVQQYKAGLIQDARYALSRTGLNDAPLASDLMDYAEYLANRLE
ncbi:MAG: polyprenyl synthetase family protein [Sphingomonadales bacterium]|nr:polyprenyl synthetase family protein [Sphingomonadales bacterium]